jgi:hypothetical protein
MSPRTIPRPARAGASALLALALVACQSPEASRLRGSRSRGADVGNRDPVVRMHEGSRIYYRIPCKLPDDKCMGPMPYSGLPGDFPDRGRRQS